MDMRNLTPHVVEIHTSEGIHVFPSEGVARVSTIEKCVQMLDGQIPLMRAEFGEVEGLPEAESNVLLIVSGIVRSALPNRADLVSPGELIRDDKGRVKGCKSLITNG